jgi:hypothetical protein
MIGRLYGLVRLAVAALVAFSIWTQYQGMLDDPNTSTVMFWSEFGYQSNALVALGLLIGGLFHLFDIQARHWWDLVRGAMVTCAAATFVLHRFLEDRIWTSPDGIDHYEQWASDMLHIWVPLFVVVDWILDPPDAKITWRQGLVWLTYPLAYCVYSLIRGPIVDWYPYDFLDPAESGWAGVVLALAAIIVGFLAISIVVAAVGNLRVRLAPGGRRSTAF